MKGWVGLVGWPTADGLPTYVVIRSRRSSAGQRKFACQRPTFYQPSSCVIESGKEAIDCACFLSTSTSMSMTPLNVTSPRNITVANYPSLALKPLVLPFAPCKLPMEQPVAVWVGKSLLCDSVAWRISSSILSSRLQKHRCSCGILSGIRCHPTPSEDSSDLEITWVVLV